MNKDSLYAFYGSLREGMSNHAHFGKGLERLFKEEISGFQLFAMEDYPYAVRTNRSEDRITVEVFKVTDRETEKGIHELELEVGYHYEEVTIRGQSVGIYLYALAGPEPLVKGGDWVEFFGSR